MGEWRLAPGISPVCGEGEGVSGLSVTGEVPQTERHTAEELRHSGGAGAEDAVAADD